MASDSVSLGRPSVCRGVSRFAALCLSDSDGNQISIVLTCRSPRVSGVCGPGIGCVERKGGIFTGPAALDARLSRGGTSRDITSRDAKGGREEAVRFWGRARP